MKWYLRSLGQALLLAASVCIAIPVATWGEGETITIDFEGEGETKTAYAVGTVTLSGFEWELNEALIGSDEGDLWGESERSLRMRGWEASAMTLLDTLWGGVDTISFEYRRYGSDTQVDWRVEYTTDNGATWVQVGDDFTAPSTNVVQTFSEPVNVSDPVRVRIARATMDGGAVNLRLNIDNIVLEVPAILPPPAPEVPTALPATGVQATQFVANWEAVSENFSSYELEVAISDQFLQAGETVFVDFEGDGETKGSYASATRNISGYDWDLTQALIGSEEGDWKEGERALRMRGYEDSAFTLLEDLLCGLSQISFSYRRYGTDEQVDWKVEYSVDQGGSWTQIGDDFTAPDSDDVQTFSESLSVTDPVRVRIVRATMDGNETDNKRLNVDNIELLPFSTVDEVVEGYDPLNTTETSVLVEGLDPEATHFYRVRTVGLDDTRSDWSDVIRVGVRAPTVLILR